MDDDEIPAILAKLMSILSYSYCSPITFTMKYLVFACALWHLAQGGPTPNTLPEYLKPYTCKASDPEFEKCIRQAFEDTRPYLVAGIPELGMPPIDPFELPVLVVNRTLNQLVSISATCRNIRIIGGSNIIIDSVKADPISHSGEIRVTLPFVSMDMDYEVNGQLLIVPLQSKGHFSGNFSDTQMYVKGSLKKYLRDGVEYFKVNKISAKITVGDGRISMIEKNKDMQYAADLITDFFNQNPRRVMDAINPLFIEASNELFREVSDEIMSVLPASEWLPA